MSRSTATMCADRLALSCSPRHAFGGGDDFRPRFALSEQTGNRFGIFRGICVWLPKVPYAEIVVAIGRLYDVGALVKLDSHLAEIIAEKAANPPAHRLVVPFRLTVEKHFTALAYPRTIVDEIGIDEASRKPGQ